MTDIELPDRIRFALPRIAEWDTVPSHMAPELAYGRHRGPATPRAREAAVMIALLAGPSGWTIPLTLRTIHLPAHAGQVSLPGGRLEAHENAWQAAERETDEELGIAPGTLRPLGFMRPEFVFSSNYIVYPCIAYADGPVVITPASEEVDRLLNVPIHHLIDPGNHARQLISRGSIQFVARGYCFEGLFIWGATAIILSKFLRLLHYCEHHLG